MDWLALQLSDAAFPAGGFAHSGGLEAAAQLDEMAPPALAGFVEASLWQAGFAALPAVAAAHDDPRAIRAVEAAYDAFMVNEVANRASRTQGRAFVATAARVFDEEPVAALAAAVAARSLPGHHAPVFGATLRALDVARDDTRALFLHLSLRGTLSAAIRLGLTGPHEAQRIQRAMAPVLGRVLDATRTATIDDLAHAAPVLDLVGALHDRLHVRLFQS